MRGGWGQPRPRSRRYPEPGGGGKGSPRGPTRPPPHPHDAARWLALSPLALAAALTARGASASKQWCRVDPVVRIDGEVADIVLSSYEEMEEAATGPARVVVTVPRGIEVEQLSEDEGFGGHGYDVSFEKFDDLKGTEDALRVAVRVYAPATDGSLPVRVDFEPRRKGGRLGAGSAEGTANGWVRLVAR